MRRLLVQIALSCLLLSVVIGCDKTPTKPVNTPDAPKDKEKPTDEKKIKIQLPDSAK